MNLMLVGMFIEHIIYILSSDWAVLFCINIFSPAATNVAKVVNFPNELCPSIVFLTELIKLIKNWETINLFSLKYSSRRSILILRVKAHLHKVESFSTSSYHAAG